MRIALVYSEKLHCSSLESSEKVKAVPEVARELQLELVHPEQVSVDAAILSVHPEDYLEKVKKLPFYDAAVESIRCVVKAIDLLSSCDVVALTTTATGHLAEKDRMRGCCVFNDLAILVNGLKERWSKVAVIESDAHHGTSAAIVSKDAKFFCLGKKTCRIREDMRCVLGRSIDAEEYVSSFREMISRVLESDPEVVVWYLGLDLHELEYAEMKLSRDDFASLADAISELVKGRKAVILLASGSRSDVLKETLKAVLTSLTGRLR